MPVRIRIINGSFQGVREISKKCYAYIYPHALKQQHKKDKLFFTGHVTELCGQDVRLVMSHENQSKMLKPTGNGNKLTDFALLGAVTKCIGNNIKCIQLDRELWRVKEFRDKLLTVKKGVTFVESTYDNFWGSGLNESGTKHTKPASWPGMNMFGKVLTKTADKLKRPGSVSVTGRS
ncbi:hypothetical protein KUTeg_012224 [Tegillarca granosa]|uniref:NADAR domain-containing protein n=1 Tax=Tegillarca granosa TaxID=220873 RepID=A0ABQ9EYW2_TEGGR|nr:hypothetical protein KUTeg_012224 [Tegillarca granosa]